MALTTGMDGTRQQTAPVHARSCPAAPADTPQAHKVKAAPSAARNSLSETMVRVALDSSAMSEADSVAAMASTTVNVGDPPVHSCSLRSDVPYTSSTTHQVRPYPIVQGVALPGGWPEGASH